MNYPLISVILATYRHDNLEHLHFSIDSILNQSYKNFELIVIVDGPVSNEASSYLRDVASTSNVILIWLERNGGVSHARNEGVRRARGKYIAIMDSDDISHPDRLKLQLNCIEETNADVVSSWLKIIDNNGIVVGVRRLPLSHKKIVLMSYFRCPIHNPSVFCSTEVFRRYYFDESLSVSEDYDLWVRMLTEKCKFHNMPQMLVQYRQDTKSIKKRIGLEYFKADLVVKFKTIRYANLAFVPIIVPLFFLSSLPRLLPLFLFRRIYKIKSLLF